MKVTLVLRNAPPASRPAQRAVVTVFAAANGLTVASSANGPDHLALEGPDARIARAFGVNLVTRSHPLGDYRTHREPLRLPGALHGVVAGCLGLDETPASISRRHLVRETPAAEPVRQQVLHGPPPEPITVAQLVEHYKFPKQLDGAGQRIAVISLGGGFHASDVDAFFRDLGGRAPTVRAVSVGDGTNAPLAMARLKKVMAAYNTPSISLGDLWRDFPHDLGDAISTVEATMDVQISGAAAPGADIDVYFAPNSPQGLYDAILAALRSAAPPAVISLSWGWPEGQLSGSSAEMINQALERAWNAGTCVCCASGDSGSIGAADNDLAADAASVLFPASSPWVLACGGTELAVSARGLGAESAWNSVDRGLQQATGGGVSGAFPVPIWQGAAGVPAHGALHGAAWIAPSIPPEARTAFVGRGVPDVSAYAAQSPGYKLYVGGTACGAGGTSAATPLWAGLVARLAGRFGANVRWLPQVFYLPVLSPAFRVVKRGDNAIHGATSAASYTAGTGWSACCGLGTPNGAQMIELLEQHFGAPPA